MKKALVIWFLLLAVIPLFAKQDSTKTHYELAYRFGVGSGMLMKDVNTKKVEDIKEPIKIENAVINEIYHNMPNKPP